MQISNYYHNSFLKKLIVFKVNECKKICVEGLNRQAATLVISINSVISRELMAIIRLNAMNMVISYVAFSHG